MGKRNQEPRTRAVSKRWLQIASYVLIAAGIVLLLIAGINLGYRQWERQRLLARLTRTAPTATATAAPIATPTPTPAKQPTAIPTATPKPTEPSTPAVTTMTSPTPQPTATPTATAIPPTPTPAITPQPPVRIVIPDLDIDAPVVEMGWKVVEASGEQRTEWDLSTIENGKVGHLINSALPGQPGNVVLSGHHNIEGKVFKNISLAWSDEDAELLEDGITWRSPVLDGRTIIIYDAAGRKFRYVIEGMYKLPDKDVSEEQRRENARFIAPTSEPTLTLVTCWPYNDNTHRIVVVARLAQTEG